MRNPAGRDRGGAVNERMRKEPGKPYDKTFRILHIAGWYTSKKNSVARFFVQEYVEATALYNDVVVLYSEY